MIEPAFCLVDCNNFYASCERVFNPKLEGEPVVILSNGDGCVIARSNEAKKLGIEMGAPVFKVQNIIDRYNVQVYSSNYVLYGDMSERVMNTLEMMVPDIELYSIDEAFLLLNNPDVIDRTTFARSIRDIVRQYTGIPVSIGVANTKTLAKVANKTAKKFDKYGGVLDITGHPKLDDLLLRFKVGDVWGVGRKYAEMLNSHGILSAYQLKNADDYFIKKKMTIMGLRTVYELRGISCIEFEQTAKENKTIIRTGSFGKSVSNLSELKESIAFHTSRAAEKLREQELIASQVRVFLNTNIFKAEEPQYYNSISVNLPLATSFTPELMHYAFIALEKIFRPDYLYKKAGIMLSELIHESKVQLNLFTARNNEKEKQLMEALDKINNKFGRNKIQFGAIGIEKDWKPRPALRSPYYTTRWTDIPVVRAINDFI